MPKHRNSKELDSMGAVIGANLSHLRAIAGLSQKALGEKLAHPIAAQQISKYELGINRLSGETMVEMAQVLGCNVGDFFKVVSGRHEYTAMPVSRGAVEMMINYSALTPRMQTSVRNLVGTMAKENRHDGN